MVQGSRCQFALTFVGDWAVLETMYFTLCHAAIYPAWNFAR